MVWPGRLTAATASRTIGASELIGERDTVKDRGRRQLRPIFIVLGLVLGIGAGAGLGAVTDNMATWVAIGAGVGLGLGAFLAGVR